MSAILEVLIGLNILIPKALKSTHFMDFMKQGRFVLQFEMAAILMMS